MGKKSKPDSHPISIEALNISATLKTRLREAEVKTILELKAAIQTNSLCDKVPKLGPEGMRQIEVALDAYDAKYATEEAAGWRHSAVMAAVVTALGLIVVAVIEFGPQYWQKENKGQREEEETAKPVAQRQPAEPHQRERNASDAYILVSQVLASKLHDQLVIRIEYTHENLQPNDQIVAEVAGNAKFIEPWRKLSVDQVTGVTVVAINSPSARGGFIRMIIYDSSGRLVYTTKPQRFSSDT